MKTPQEIRKEIKALEACKGYIPHRTAFGDDNHHKVDLQLKVLRGQLDVVGDDWDGFSDDEQSSILEARDWMDGQIEESPSSGWDNYKPKR